MIKKFKDYDKTQGYSDYQMLPTGGYVLKIMGAEVCKNSRGEYIKIGIDIAEGEYADFYTKDYQAQKGEDKKWRGNYLLSVPTDDGSEQDGWTKRRFKTFTESLEDSNDGYHFDWDEAKFKGKLIGGLFNIREYQKADGSIGSATNLAVITTVEKIRKGDYKLPKDRLLDKPAQAPANMDFMNVEDSLEDELPFK